MIEVVMADGRKVQIEAENASVQDGVLTLSRLENNQWRAVAQFSPAGWDGWYVIGDIDGE